jgi:hypothetical protein
MFKSCRAGRGIVKIRQSSPSLNQPRNLVIINPRKAKPKLPHVPRRRRRKSVAPCLTPKCIIYAVYSAKYLTKFGAAATDTQWG